MTSTSDSIPTILMTPAGDEINGTSPFDDANAPHRSLTTDVLEMLSHFNAKLLNGDQVSSWLHAYFWAYWAPIFPRSQELQDFWTSHATCISGEAVIGFLEHSEFPPQYPLDEDPEEATVDVFLPETIAQEWISLHTNAGWLIERVDVVEGYGAFSSRITHVRGGTATQVTRLYKKVVDEPDWGYASVYRMDVVHAFDFGSNLPILTFTGCLEHSPHLYTRYLSVIIPSPSSDHDTYDHWCLEFLRPVRPHILHGRPRLNDPTIRMDVGVRFANGSLSWYDRTGHRHVDHLLEIEMRNRQLLQRRI
ncbi:hypothetical protein SISNIDRAFT_471841 [Sistotremastrum niveocremeum HHB9708]|uniref:Uncharacterized protein n=1 Tax=Sistotremastrum niveocremeum HHB9708 TaxID=1314777 RepID=A0A164M594_9AGAM|nr:hypothetical protein SISNIDRAFT_471841 [Sistotremastrum niveocremeum HHB9708]